VEYNKADTEEGIGALAGQFPGERAGVRLEAVEGTLAHAPDAGIRLRRTRVQAEAHPVEARQQVLPARAEQVAVRDERTAQPQVKRMRENLEVLRVDGGFAAAGELDRTNPQRGAVVQDLKRLRVGDEARRVVVHRAIRARFAEVLVGRVPFHPVGAPGTVVVTEIREDQLDVRRRRLTRRTQFCHPVQVPGDFPVAVLVHAGTLSLL